MVKNYDELSRVQRPRLADGSTFFQGAERFSGITWPPGGKCSKPGGGVERIRGRMFRGPDCRKRRGV